MFKTTLGCGAGVVALILALAYARASAQEPAGNPPQPISQQRALVDRYCVSCHNERLQTAGLMLDKMNVGDVGEGAQVWERVLVKVRSGQMPPAGMRRPDKASYDSFAAYLEAELDRAADARPDPGRPAAVRRLNRTEYTNIIRDLLALEIDGGLLLPTDDSSYGFDNIAEALSVSPLLLERYMTAAEKISRVAIGDPKVPPTVETYEVPDSVRQDTRVSEDLPFGSSGGMSVRHYFPLDAEYVIKIGMQKTERGESADILGFEEPKQLDLRLDGATIKLFTVGGAVRTDEGLEVRIPVSAGPRLVGVTFPKDSMKPEDVARGRGGDGSVASVTIGGPYNVKGPGDTPSRRKIFVCHPAGRTDEEPCAKKIFSTLTRLAYRRPVSDRDVQPLLDLYKASRTKGGFEAGIRTALEAMLVSPGFLFRVERDPAKAALNSVYRISDVELASRLSFFLWSSIPDVELLDLAERGRLKNREVLEQQVRRMLADPRSKAIVNNFAAQWLHVRSLADKAVDRTTFPEFDEDLRQAFQRETELFFESVMREDRSVLDLLSADYTFVNERLAQHYGIPNVYGPFQRVTLGDGHENRKGLLGKGSLLTVTSYNTRTSPVLRGQWVLENILGTPPPPPPPNVPALKEDSAAKALTMRERMQQHRANPACASCHKLMDPVGLALENFDAIGKWRTKEANTTIDVSGELIDGTKFEGPSGLREVLLQNSNQFVETFAEKLLTYALGRGVAYYDRPAIRKILREAAPDYRWSSLLMGIVKSAPFQMRRSGES